MSEFLRDEYFVGDMPDGYFKMIPRGSIRLVPFPEGSKHNASWDFLLCEDGMAYVPLCGELSQPLSVQLFSFDTHTGKLERCFDASNEFFVGNREIPPSKIHTSLSRLRDGRILMTTHTTARSPRHAYWLFDSYYEHLYEGYPGSHVLIWNPETRELKNLGIPVKRDSIYGGCYDAEHNAFFFTTFLKGNLYRLDLGTMEVRELGQITEMGSFSLFADGRGGIYTSSRSGHVFRIDCESCEIRDLGTPGNEPEPLFRWKFHRLIAHHAKGPDGCVYFTMHFSGRIYRLDPETLRIDSVSLAPRGKWCDAPPPLMAGHVFDSRGVLWYLESRESVNAYPGGTLHLFRCDLFHHGEPEYMGLVGVAEHNCAMVSEVAIDANDVMHFPDGNHGEDMAWMASIDLGKLEALRAEPREISRDVWAWCPFADGKRHYPGTDFEADSARHFRFRRYMIEDGEYRSRLANTKVEAASSEIVRCWEMLPFAEDHTVRSLRFLADDELEIRCGVSGEWRFLLRNGGVEGPEHGNDFPPLAEFVVPGEWSPEKLPSRSGRRMLAGITAAARMDDGVWLLGSGDGVFSLWNPETDRIFALGAVGAHGPVRALAASGDGRTVFGISGDREDLGHVIRFDRERGLCDLGRACRDLPDSVIASNAELSAVAVNFDGTRCAVGAAGRLATVYVFNFPSHDNKGAEKRNGFANLH